MKNYNDEFDRYGAERDDEILEAEVAEDDRDYDEILEGEYEDGYEYAGDRLGKVLDEIADLKRNIGESGGNYRYQSAGANEAALYNEINRLRDELSRTQHSQSMQNEFNKMREELERDSKRKEEKLLNEIDSLQRQIGSVKTADAEENVNDEAGDAGPDMTALVKMNESLVEYTKSMSDKMSADIEQIKRTVAETPVLGEIKSKLDEISARPAPAAQPMRGTKPCRAHREERCRRGETDGTEIMRRLVDIRLAIGKLSQKEYENDLRLLSLYNTLTSAKSAVYSDACGLGDKLDAMRKLDNEILLSDDCYIADVVDKYNELVDRLLDKQVAREDIAVVSGLSKLDKIKSLLSAEGKAAVNKFFAASAAVMASDNLSAAIDRLPELVSLKNVVQNNRAKAENDALYSEILSLNSELVLSADPSATAKLSEDMKAAIGALCRLGVREIMAYPKMTYDKPACAIAVHSYVREATEKAASANAEESFAALSEAVENLRAEIAETKIGTPGELADIARKIAETQTENREKILGELAELKSRLDNAETRRAENESAQPVSSTPDEVNLFLSEIVSLRDELQAYKDEVSNFAEKRVTVAETDGDTSGLGTVLDELSSIRADINEYADELENLRSVIEAGGATAVAEDKTVGAGVSVLGDIRDDLEDIKRASEKAVSGEELLSVRDEIIAELGKSADGENAAADDAVLAAVNEIKQQLADARLYSACVESDENTGAAAAELKALRESVDKLALAYSAPESSVAAEIASLKAEMAEIKTLLGANVAPRTDTRTDELVEKIYGDVRLMCDEPDYSVMNEILALREEYQNLKETINKALSGKDKTGDDKLFDEIRSLRDQIFAINMASVSDGEKESYESYNNLIIDELGRIRDELDSVAGSAKGADNEAIARLEKEIAEQKDMQASIIELLNRTLEQLQKQEKTLKSRTDNMAAEIASTLDKESEKEDAKQAKVMSDIENIKYTLGVMQGADKNDDADLEKSIEKLKEELAQVAGLIKGDKKKK